MKSYALFIALLFATKIAIAQNPVEVGDVNWGRDYQAALSQSQNSGKPIFLLFQEVPGCAGCKQFGQDVLSDPNVVNVIEQNFIPLLIHNNKGGEDARIRKKFKEPAWNYQVVRFLDSKGEDIIPRKDRVWSTSAIMARIEEALTEYQRGQLSSTSTETARVALCQYCFWTGETKIGAIPGVLETEAGFIGGREVTLVTYDPQEVSLEALVGTAADEGVATAVYLDDPSTLPGAKKLSNYRRAPESDQKRQIAGTIFSDLQLTSRQATKINAFARTNPNKALEYLTPEQRNELRN